MLSDVSDYRLSIPPTTYNICGDIIPTFDIRGIDAPLRREDAYYIRELSHAFFYGNTFFDIDTIPQVRSSLSYVKSRLNPNNLFTSELRTRNHLSDGISEHDCGTAASHLNLFFNWAVNNNKFAYWNLDESEPVIGSEFDGDYIRRFYKILASKSYRHTIGVDSFKISDFGFSAPETSFTFDFPLVNSSGEVYFTTKSKSLKVDGHRIVCSGNTESNMLGVVHLTKYESGTQYHYYRNCLPTGGVDFDVTFNNDVEDAYALVYDQLDNSYAFKYRGSERLVHMTGSGRSWSVHLMDEAKERVLLPYVGFTDGDLDRWMTGSNKGAAYFSTGVLAIFAKFNSLYFDLPSSWVWP